MRSRRRENYVRRRRDATSPHKLLLARLRRGSLRDPGNCVLARDGDVEEIFEAVDREHL